MTRLMIIVASIREGRKGLPIGRWVRSEVEKDGRFEVDWVDLRELNLPIMDEPNHPMLGQYTQDHSKAWSERVDAADAFIFVQPEYNHSFSPALKNALDYLHREWGRKPLGTVSYGGISGGTRGVASLRPVTTVLGLVATRANVELAWAGNQIEDDVFSPRESQGSTLRAMLDELKTLDTTLRPLRDN